ncbi:hypothetical protein QIH77_02265 [Bradyrhizobium diazoefficiens]|uniref:hypothetical protein n=1 Tax=Bradyrhizobium diazoefficiens TaxID=1355477 RepID=UPI002729A97D|nr:hypothetical protein [Bradyrhizobium diazoefficiens]WLA74083.1 hypothetical protein QIH77_02265 [Bradyrhizobium diazoefficiens]
MIDADQISNCARILLATTGSWTPSDGNNATLTEARTMLAPVIYASGGTGFPAPATDDAIKQPEMQDAWKSCVAAAQAAVDEDGNPHAPFGNYVVFWAADPANPAKLGDGLGLNWPTQPDSHIARVSGPILDKGDPKPKRLFFFDTVNTTAALEADADARPGFWPRASAKPVDAGAAAALQAGVAAENIPKRLGLATILFVLWIISGGVLALWLWETGSAMQNAARDFKQTGGNACTTLAADKKIAWSDICETTWQTGWKKLYPDPAPAAAPPPAAPPAQAASISKQAHDMLASFRYRVGGLLWNADGHLSLFTPFVLTMASFVLLMLAAGLAIKGLWFGLLIDDRNRISMARTQQAAWSVLLLSAMAIMGWFNSTGISLIDPSERAGVELFPTMVGALWAALGINLVATPFLSDVILSNKDTKKKDETAGNPQPNPPAAPTLAVRNMVTPAEIANKRSANEAGWTDLITGETKGADQAIDISRVQHLVISGTLLTTYLMALADALGDLGGPSIMTAVATKGSIFPSMPGVGTYTFLGLLGISHAGYLVFKAIAPEGTAPDKPQSNQTPTSHN